MAWELERDLRQAFDRFVTAADRRPAQHAPRWACSQWGSSGHDWMDCPECVKAYEAWIEGDRNG
jgi:hypothetical protein